MATSYTLSNYDGVQKKDIVGWAVWYTDGTRKTSLDTNPQKLDTTNIQAVQIFFHHPKGYTYPDGTKKLYRHTFTGYDLYDLGITLKTDLTGEWTTLEKHDEIVNQAKEYWLT